MLICTRPLPYPLPCPPPLNPQVPIYLSPGMGTKAALYYKLYAEWTSPHVQQIISATGHNPFAFRHVSQFNRSALTDSGPCVLFATPGSMTGGLAQEAFRAWAGGT